MRSFSYSSVDKELGCLRHTFISPVEWLSILWPQDHQKVRLVHTKVCLAEENILRAQIADYVLWRHFNHPCEDSLLFSCKKIKVSV